MSQIENKVVNENCILFLENLKKVNKEKVFDHVITDIPYGVVSRKQVV